MADDSDEERQKYLEHSEYFPQVRQKELYSQNRLHVNQPYDESLDVQDQEEVASVYAPSPNPHPGGDRGRSRGDTPPDSRMSELSDEDFDTGRPDPQEGEEDPEQQGDDEDDDDDDDGEEIEISDDEDEDQAAQGVGGASETGAGMAGAIGAMAANAAASLQPQAPVATEAPVQPQAPVQEEAPLPSDEVPVQAEVAPVNAAPVQTQAALPAEAPVKAPQALAPLGELPAKSKVSQQLGQPPLGTKPGGSKPGAPMYGGEEEDDEEESGSTDEEDDDDEDGNGGAVEGAYDPADYDHLPVTPEIKELFQYITRYTPQSIELDHKLKPFIPDYIPAVGDIDAFIKVGRPDGKPDQVGLTVLDEPCAKQSDPTVLKLTLRTISKQTTMGDMVVKSVEDADRDPRAIESWIESIRDLHRSKPPPNVHYTKNMPDIDTLMQEWPGEFEELLKEVGLPTADLDCDLATYVDMICAILDIPVYKSRIQSLHVLFTLYSEFKNSQHFRVLAAENKLDNSLKGGAVEDSDRLIL